MRQGNACRGKAATATLLSLKKHGNAPRGRRNYGNKISENNRDSKEQARRKIHIVVPPHQRRNANGMPLRAGREQGAGS